MLSGPRSEAGGGGNSGRAGQDRVSMGIYEMLGRDVRT